MREPFKLADAAIIAALQTHYGLAITALTFLPLGADSATAVYSVDALAGAKYFLKVRTGAGFSVPSLAVPRYLHAQGVSHLVAPLPTLAGALWVSVDGFALSLYPFIDGRIGAQVGLSDEHWRALGAMLKLVHASPLTYELLQIVPREPFIPTRRSVIEDLETALNRPDLTDPLQRELAAFWHSRRDEIRTLVARADRLGRQLRDASPPLPMVLCHADLHPWNVLLDSAGPLWVVDWDETMLAPKERDLMFVVGGIGGDGVGPHTTACFMQGYGDAPIDPRALTYYRYAWAVQDMAAWGEQVLFMPDLGEASRRDGVHGFIGQFGPGNIVELALAFDGTTI
ncbi:MAG: phosphotransferase [Anaerolineae bacterium]